MSAERETSAGTSEAQNPEDVTIRYVASCKEGNCGFSMDHPDESKVQRIAGRHEGNNDFQHQVSIEVEVDAV